MMERATFYNSLLFRVILLLLWLIAMGVLLWWFSLGQLRQFNDENTVIHFDGENVSQAINDLLTIAGLDETEGITLLHFRDSRCPCTLSNDQHLQEIIQDYSARGINFLVIDKNEVENYLSSSFSSSLYHIQLSNIPIASDIHRLPSSPAVGIVDANGDLAYFGPYSLGAFCNAADGFVETTLDLLLDQQKVSNLNTVGIGCFCPWAEIHLQKQPSLKVILS